ncbi:hypothetical protein HDV02_004471 [Globomyces sp. JEL0801]|nr:hypothetical protein HDV02_004471 [Globomyces sp. JEL0801]
MDEHLQFHSALTVHPRGRIPRQELVGAAEKRNQNEHMDNDNGSLQESRINQLKDSQIENLKSQLSQVNDNLAEQLRLGSKAEADHSYRLDQEPTAKRHQFDLDAKNLSLDNFKKQIEFMRSEINLLTTELKAKTESNEEMSNLHEQLHQSNKQSRYFQLSLVSLERELTLFKPSKRQICFFGNQDDEKGFSN